MQKIDFESSAPNRRNAHVRNVLELKNIFFSVKLADFGLARIYDFRSLLTTVVVTLW